MNTKKIIGIAGTNGSGKDTVGHILADKYNYLFISVTDLLRDEAKRRGQPVEREVLRTISAQWRREAGLGVLIDKAIEKYEAARGGYSGLAIASLRNPGEADRVHELDGLVVWVDADPRIRYGRIQANVDSRGRSGEDDKTFEQFLAEEQTEMHQSGDAATLDMAAVKDRADVLLENNGDDLKTFSLQLEQALGLT